MSQQSTRVSTNEAVVIEDAGAVPRGNQKRGRDSISPPLVEGIRP
jgi:hypothetical protein